MDRLLSIKATVMRPRDWLARVRDRVVDRIGIFVLIFFFPDLAPNRIRATVSTWHVAVNTILNGLTLWVAFRLIEPDLLVSGIEGMRTLAQAIPALIVALFIFVLGALFAVAQVAINSYGQRGVLVLAEDLIFIHAVVRLLVLAAADRRCISLWTRRAIGLSSTSRVPLTNRPRSAPGLNTGASRAFACPASTR
jgi:hypothetical protein